MLRGEISNPRPLIPADLSDFSDEAGQTIQLFRTLRELHDEGHDGALEAYVVSHAESEADMLDVLLLMKEAGLAESGGDGALMRIVPLFESGETLKRSPETMAKVLDEPVYRTALKATGDVQEVMVGYSDSNKDAGYLASSWAVYEAQMGMSQSIGDRDASWIFFHGRGGAVGRGGDRPTSQSALCLREPLAVA